MFWAPVDTINFSGPVSPVSAGSQLQNGLYDNSGGIWSVTAGGDLSSLQAAVPRNNGLLLLQSAGQSVNQRLKIDIIVGNPEKTATFIVLRSDGKSAGPTEYEVSASYNGISYFMILAGSAANAATTAYNRSLVAGEVITLDVSCVQTNSTTTSISATVTDAQGVVLATTVITDTTAGMQNFSGVPGVFMNEGVTTGTAASTLIRTVYAFDYVDVSQFFSVNHGAFLFSPANWSGDAGRGGSNWRRAWNCGAWFEFYFTASAAPTATLMLGSLRCGSTVNLYVNGVETKNVPATGVLSVPGIAASAVNVVRVCLNTTPQKERWNGGVNALLVQGIVLDTASVGGIARNIGEWGVMVGSSITEGARANGGNDDWSQDYSALLTDAFLREGIDVCMSAACYSDYILAGDSDGDVPPYCYITGGNYDDDLSRWNKVDKGVSVLDANGRFSAHGDVNTEPKFVAINYFSNGATHGSSTTDLSDSMIGCMERIRQTAPNAWIFIIVPFGFHYPTAYPAQYYEALLAAFAKYQALYPNDLRVRLIDIGKDMSVRIETAPGMLINTDLIHPLGQGHALVAPIIQSAMTAAMKPARSYVFGES